MRLNKLATTKRVDIMTEPHGNTGNKNGAKEVTKSSVLTIRCTPQEKGLWVKASHGNKLAVWVTDALNAAADK